jgi:leader peptidase (prepilin peptidase) / N-methyltransferase
LAIILLLLIWGSFLNVVAYRLVQDLSIVAPRSFCPHCKHTIAWYDNIPILSWIALGGRCRTCKAPISVLYPAIEALTAIALSALFYLIVPAYWFGYFIFFSALIVTIRSDLETMLISRYVTLYAVPLGWLLSACGLLSISLFSSITGSVLGYLFLWAIAKGFSKITGKAGMGQGDLDLLAFIGAFIGPFGCWVTLIISSTIGALCGTLYLILFAQKKKSVAIPFGPFLALAAMTYVLFSDFFVNLFISQ